MSYDYPHIRPVSDAAASFFPWAKGPVWMLTDPWSFHVKDGTTLWSYTIPAGFAFDGQSIPGIFHGWPLYYNPAGVGFRAGLQHDFLTWLYQGGSPWLKEQFPEGLPTHPPIEVINQHYMDVQIEDGQRPSKAFWTGLAVKLFGPGGLLKPSTIWQKIKP